LIETLQTALSGADLYYWFVSGFGNMDHLASPYAAAFDVPIIGAIVALTVQYFFAYRVWILSGKKSRWLSLTICMVSESYNSETILCIRPTLFAVLYYLRYSGDRCGYLCKFHMPHVTATRLTIAGTYKPEICIWSDAEGL
jgi:hypothetical protein